MASETAATASPKVAPTHHFGRGGAGNKTAKDVKSPAIIPESTPTLKGEMYTTGRGGSGNMAKNDPSRPEEARAAQDLGEIPEMSLPAGPRSVGRGGAANVHIPTEDEKVAALRNNERLRRESGNKDKDRSGLKGLAEKGKELFGGKKNTDGEK